MEPVGCWGIAETATVILAGSIPLVPGFVKYARGQETSERPSQENALSSLPKKWGRSTFKLNGQSLPSTDASKGKGLVGNESDVQLNAPSLQNAKEDLVIATIQGGTRFSNDLTAPDDPIFPSSGF